MQLGNSCDFGKEIENILPPNTNIRFCTGNIYVKYWSSLFEGEKMENWKRNGNEE